MESSEWQQFWRYSEQGQRSTPGAFSHARGDAHVDELCDRHGVAADAIHNGARALLLLHAPPVYLLQAQTQRVLHHAAACAHPCTCVIIYASPPASDAEAANLHPGVIDCETCLAHGRSISMWQKSGMRMYLLVAAPNDVQVAQCCVILARSGEGHHTPCWVL